MTTGPTSGPTTGPTTGPATGPVDASGRPVVWRQSWLARVPFGVLCLVLGALGVWGVVTAPAEPLFWFLVVVMLFGATTLRPRVVLTDDALDARGRFARRRVPLADLRQVTTGLGGHVWVRTHGPLDRRGNDVLYLRMIPRSPLSGGVAPAGDDAVALIRRRAESLGATLDPRPAHPTAAPSRRPLLFSI